MGYSRIIIYSGIHSGIYSRIYSSYSAPGLEAESLQPNSPLGEWINDDDSAPGSRIARTEIQVFQNENSSQTNAYSHYSKYSYSRLISNEHALYAAHITDSFMAVYNKFMV